MNVNLDQISDLSEEEQQQFFEHTQKHLRKVWAKIIRNQTEKEIDLERKKDE